MFGKGMYLSVFYCLCYDKDISTDMQEDQVAEERYPNLNEDEDIILGTIREDHWREVYQEGGDKNKSRALRWEVYVKNKDKLIKREFPVYITHPTGGGHCLDQCEG